MDWSDHLTRIRRWVRDPDGDIFTENFLLRLFNDELQQLYSLLSPVADVQAVRTHPEFQGSYTHDWEWAHTDHDAGDVYHVGGYYDAGEYTYLYIWEPEQLKGFAATTSDAGDVYTQPWEAWAVTTAHFPPPIPLPADFERVLFMAYDRDPIDPESKREIMGADDTTWKTRDGSPLSYWRDAKNNSWIRLYPIPPLTWQDDEEASGDPDEAEYGSTTVDVDNNLLVIYAAAAAEVEDDEDTTGLPEFLAKYVEYGTASRALRANTDGRIESLADYWEMRKKAGYEVLRKWMRLKLTDRAMQLRTRDSSGIGQRPKYPRLPSTYPDGWA